MQQSAIGVVLVACIALALIVGDGIDLTARIEDGDAEQRNIMVLTEQFPRRMTDVRKPREGNAVTRLDGDP